MSLVLIVDDDADIREMLTLLLEDAGHRIVTAAQGEEALHVLSQGIRPDLVIADLMMPVMSGWELRERMLRDPAIASIPTIVMTGDQQWSQRGESLGAVASVAKPFDADVFVALVGRVLGPLGGSGSAPVIGSAHGPA